jgi:diguanylate cyclase (GGDEF)-like protein/PAS domain S-box-containing protein
MPDTRPSAKVLGNLLLAMETFDILPDVEGMAQFLRSALREVPGVADALICMSGSALPVGQASTALVDLHCPIAGDLSASAPLCSLEGRRDVRQVAVRTSRRAFGCLLLVVGDEARFLTYVPFLFNIGHIVAAVLENRGNAQALAGSLRESEERFRALAGAAPIGILEVSPLGLVRYANPRMSEITGRDVQELMGQGWAQFVQPDDAPAVLARVARPPTEEPATFRIQRPGGEVRHVRALWAPKGQDPDAGYVATVEDITDEVAAREALTYQAFHDGLTGLPNRALFLDRLDQELARSRRGGPGIAVLFLDLDRFKIVNDSLGHSTGDAVLKELGGRFMHGVRAGETAARFGGDEFIFIIRDVNAPQDATGAARRLQSLLEAPVRCGGQDVIVTGSVGIVIPAAQADAASVLRDADAAMYRAKDEGRNRYALFDEAMHGRSVARFEMEGELRQALERNEFEVYYQPVVEPQTGRPVGAEALVRWEHPSRGLVGPLQFIPVAEDSGLIKPLGRWVLEQAVAQLASWDADRAGPRLDLLAVNLSARQLDAPETADIVRGVLDRYGTAPGRICLEVTESVVMLDNISTRRSLGAFKDLGLRVAIDDFGTGYSSLAYLHALPVTTVKVDRSFVERLGAGDDSTPVVRAVIEMAHAMSLSVVAEGVSSERLRDLVSAMGCDSAQGFYWSPPLPAADFACWWREAEEGRAAALVFLGRRV